MGIKNSFEIRNLFTKGDLAYITLKGTVTKAACLILRDAERWEKCHVEIHTAYNYLCIKTHKYCGL